MSIGREDSVSGASGAGIAGLLLAAGASSRMGPETNKLLQTVQGRPLVMAPVEAMRRVLGTSLLVVLGHESERIREALDGNVATTLHSAWAEGMGASIAHGVRILLDTRSKEIPRGILICVGDLPGLESSVVEAVVAAFQKDADANRICVPTHTSGRDGHPVLFGAGYFEALSVLEGDRGARAIVDRAGDAVVRVPIDSDGILRDVDTPEDLADWQS